jgi:hypothetical protein
MSGDRLDQAMAPILLGCSIAALVGLGLLIWGVVALVRWAHHL